METEHFYDVTVKWENGREGKMSSTHLIDVIEVATPPEFPKGVGGVWSPEHLLVGAVNSCLMTTFLAIAENSNLEFTNFRSKAVGKLEKVDGKYMVSEITLAPIVEIAHENDEGLAAKVLLKSEAACLITNSIKSKIVYHPVVRLAHLA
jgi:peroxiredoxin-like protein